MLSNHVFNSYAKCQMLYQISSDPIKIGDLVLVFCINRLMDMGSVTASSGHFYCVKPNHHALTTMYGAGVYEKLVAVGVVINLDALNAGVIWQREPRKEITIQWEEMPF